jgi:hypothetical protein
VRGYKQEQSVLRISRLIALAGNHLARGLRLGDLMVPGSRTRSVPSSLRVFHPFTNFGTVTKFASVESGYIIIIA